MRKSKLFWETWPIVISIGAVLVSVIILFRNLIPFENMVALLSAIVATITGISMVYAFSRMIRRKAAIFVSFSYNDKDAAMKIVNDLKKEGYRIYVPNEIIAVGDNIQQTLQKAIDNANFFIYLISQNSINSSWVSKEYEYARSRNIKIFPVLLFKVDVPAELRNIRYVDFSQDYDQAYRFLETSIRKNVGHLKPKLGWAPLRKKQMAVFSKKKTTAPRRNHDK